MRGWIYDRAVTRLTAGWYRAVLERLPQGARLLDVGIGTGGALAACAALVRERRLSITGIDVDAKYLARAARTIERAGLSPQVTLRHCPLDQLEDDPFGAVYFSGSFMLMPDPAVAARVAARLLAGPEARVYFTQTFEEARAPWLERIKPLLFWLTTIDFGRVSYETPFRAALEDGGLQIEEQVMLARRGRRSSRLLIARRAG